MLNISQGLISPLQPHRAVYCHAFCFPTLIGKIAQPFRIVTIFRPHPKQKSRQYTARWLRILLVAFTPHHPFWGAEKINLIIYLPVAFWQVCSAALRTVMPMEAIPSLIDCLDLTSQGTARKHGSFTHSGKPAFLQSPPLPSLPISGKVYFSGSITPLSTRKKITYLKKLINGKS